MDENNKYCACTGSDAMFHIKLNQQGPEGKQGPQGIKGIDGISPSISVESSTQNNYQLRVSTAYNTFVTPNLKGDNKVEIDPWTLTKPTKITIPQFTLNKTVTNSDLVDGYANVSGGLSFQVNIDDRITGTHGVKTNFTFPFTSVIRQNGIITSRYSGNLLTSKSVVANDPIILTHNQDGTLTLDFDDTDYQGKLTAGSNINITNNTISVTGMPTKVSDLTNDAGYLTAIPSEYVTDSELTAKGYVTNTELNNKGYVTTSSLNVILEGYAETDEVNTALEDKQDKFATVTDSESTTSLNTNGKALSITASTIAVGDNLVNEINGTNTQLYLKQNDVVAGDNITVTKTATGIVVTGTASQYTLPIASTTTLGGIKVGENLTIDADGTLNASGGGSGGTTEEKYGIQGDYATHYGILDCPNGLIDYNATGKDITLNQGIVLQLAGQDSKTTIATAITKTLTSSTPITLFYGGGELLEVGKVDYSTTEPTDNGVDNYQAWYNPTLGKWQFKSNDSGNIWRELVATPIANINLNDSNITRVDYIGYRILDDDILVQQSEIETLNETITILTNTINTLESRLAALEANINGGNA